MFIIIWKQDGKCILANLVSKTGYSKMYLSGYCSHNAGSRDGFPKGNSKVHLTMPFLLCLLLVRFVTILPLWWKIFDIQMAFLLVQVSSKILYLHLYSYHISLCIFTKSTAQNFFTLWCKSNRLSACTVNVLENVTFVCYGISVNCQPLSMNLNPERGRTCG